MSNKKKDDINNNITQNNQSLRNYKKRGTFKENEIDELYTVTTKKLGDKYRNRLSLLMYKGNQVKNYFSKRANLDDDDDVIYESDNEEKLYITSSHFKNKSKANSLKDITKNKNNSSIQNFTENMSKFMTNDTNNYNSKDNISDDKKEISKIKEMYKRFKEEKMNLEIKKLLLNEEKEMPKYLERQIFDQLSKKYNFMKEEDKKSPKKKSNTYRSQIINKNAYQFYPNNNNLYSFNFIKGKTDELNTLKARNFRNYLSPIFFLGKTRDKFLNRISYASHEKFRKKIKKQNINDIKTENIRFLNIMGKDINELHEINKNNKNILTGT